MLHTFEIVIIVLVIVAIAALAIQARSSKATIKDTAEADFRKLKAELHKL